MVKLVLFSTACPISIKLLIIRVAVTSSDRPESRHLDYLSFGSPRRHPCGFRQIRFGLFSRPSRSRDPLGDYRSTRKHCVICVIDCSDDHKPQQCNDSRVKFCPWDSAYCLYGKWFCPMKIGHKSRMALYPSIITLHGLSWELGTT